MKSDTGELSMFFEDVGIGSSLTTLALEHCFFCLDVF